jgi:CRISPR/Cas system endoribonuclease Cas6 (RAMP superfamily)
MWKRTKSELNPIVVHASVQNKNKRKCRDNIKTENNFLSKMQKKNIVKDYIRLC